MEKWYAFGWTGHGGSGDFAETLREPTVVSEEFPAGLLRVISKKYFAIPEGQVYNFYDDVNDDYNVVYSEIKKYISADLTELELSSNLTKYLHTKITHPKTPASHVIIGKTTFIDEQVIFIAKLESLDAFISIDNQESVIENFGFNEKSKIKIAFVRIETPHQVLVSTDEIETKYWLEDFLSIRLENNNFVQTQNIIKAVSEFSKTLYSEEDIDDVQRAVIATKSINFIKQSSEFDLEKFSDYVFSESDQVETFEHFVQNKPEYQDLSEESFSISQKALKVNQKSLTRTITLDGSVQITIKSPSADIDRGYDEVKGKSFITIYYTRES